MKNILILLSTIFFFNACVKQEPIAQSELTGIWKLNGYHSTNYKIEITNDGYAYWFNYNDIYNNIEEFEVEYEINTNTLKFYFHNKNYASHIIQVYKDHKGRLSLTVPIYGVDANGSAVVNYDTYYQMN